MQRCEVILKEVRLESGGQVSGQIYCPAGLRPGPGQYLLAHAPGREEALPTPVFAARYLPAAPAGEGQPGELELAPPLPSGWTAGMRLVVRGPLGRGFSLPASARRVGLVELGQLPHRLLPLAGQALAQGAEVALYTRSVPGRLPPEVEVLPLEGLSEALTWADYLAFDLAPSGLAGLKKRFGLAPHTIMPVPAQVLVTVPMPCGGLGDCGLCAVDLKRGWKLACKDGPVFDLNELEEG
jgi:dihydroorotate dehydrogenase electron transfer subunit